MEEYPKEFDRFLQTDLKTAIKIEDDPNYYNRLLKADGYIKDLRIKSEMQFYIYSIVIEELNGITYNDVEAFQRFEYNAYYEKVKKSLPQNKVVKLKRIK